MKENLKYTLSFSLLFFFIAKFVVVCFLFFRYFFKNLIIFFICFCEIINVYQQLTGSWSASTSPARSPSPSRYGGHLPRTRRPELPYPTYGTTSLCQRSRSPSPARLQEMRERDRLGYGIDMGTLSLSLSTTTTHTLYNIISYFTVILSLFIYKTISF